MMRKLLVSFYAGVLFAHSSAQAQQPTAPNTSISNTAHAHETHGPHGGELLEVGKEEYHVELVIEEAKSELKIYLLDKAVKSYVAIDAPFLTVNLKVDGKPVQVKLRPVPQEMDKPGFSSSYEIVSQELVTALHDSHSDARLAMKIAKKPYVVKFVHNHDHSGHDHSGHDHAGHQHPGPKVK